jgi:hypothetical protein
VSELSSTSLTLTGDFAVAGTMLSSGNLSVNGNKFVVYMDSGNTNVAGNLLSSGNLSVNDGKIYSDCHKWQHGHCRQREGNW